MQLSPQFEFYILSIQSSFVLATERMSTALNRQPLLYLITPHPVTRQAALLSHWLVPQCCPAPPTPTLSNLLSMSDP